MKEDVFENQKIMCAFLYINVYLGFILLKPQRNQHLIKYFLVIFPKITSQLLRK